MSREFDIDRQSMSWDVGAEALSIAQARVVVDLAKRSSPDADAKARWDRLLDDLAALQRSGRNRILVRQESEDIVGDIERAVIGHRTFCDVGHVFGGTSDGETGCPHPPS